MRQPPGRAAVFAIFHFVGADALIGPSTPQRESPLYEEGAFACGQGRQPLHSKSMVQRGGMGKNSCKLYKWCFTFKR